MGNYISRQLELKTGISPNKVWFTSDHHFFHSIIIEYVKRPFADVNEMNEEMIARWNSVVNNDHVVFHLGDFCFGKPERWNYLLDRLKGKIYLIVGNHDIGLNDQVAERFEKVTAQMKIRIDGQAIYLNHFPFLSYSGEKFGAWQLFGHVHYNPNGCQVVDMNRLKVLHPTQYDVGVDNNNFTPVSFQQLKKILGHQSLQANCMTEEQNR